MREIKFRGREKESNKWVSGYARHWKCCYGDEWHIQGENDNVHIVIPETIGQFTGLKDHKDREIYEGDIIKTHEGDVGVIVWETELGGFRARLTDDSFYTLTAFFASMFSVIGNVHDNPELLEAHA